MEILQVMLGIVCLILLGLLWLILKNMDLVENENDELHDVVCESLKELDSQDEQIKALEAKINNLHVALDNSFGQRAKVDERLREARGGIKARDVQIEELRDTIVKLQKTVECLNSFSSQLVEARDNAVHNLDVSKKSFARDVEYWEGIAEECRELLLASETEVEELKEELHEVKSINDALQLTIASLTR